MNKANCFSEVCPLDHMITGSSYDYMHVKPKVLSSNNVYVYRSRITVVFHSGKFEFKVFGNIHLNDYDFWCTGMISRK